MKTKSIFTRLMVLFLVGSFFLFGCNVDDEPPVIEEDPTNDLGDYILPASVQDLFTPEVLEVTGSLEPFLDKIILNNMKIYQGINPPEIYKGNYRSDILLSREVQNFEVNNDCIYDEFYPSYADSIFGSYHDKIFLIREDEKATISYSSISNINPIQFPDGIDQGESVAIASGDKNNFTLFFKVNNGIHNRISYSALWIYSGTYEKTISFQNENLIESSTLTNVTKCMVLLNKGNDPNGDMANIGTIRIFRDNGPIEGF